MVEEESSWEEEAVKEVAMWKTTSPRRQKQETLANRCVSCLQSSCVPIEVEAVELAVAVDLLVVGV